MPRVNRSSRRRLPNTLVVAFLLFLLIPLTVYLLSNTTRLFTKAQTAVPPFTFAVAGDYGASSDAKAGLQALATSGSEFNIALGDLSYGDITPESAWCDLVKSYVGQEYPFQILAGNHENDYHVERISNYIPCLPDRIGTAQGVYGKDYFFDYPTSLPLTRFILLSPYLTLDGVKKPYTKGDANYNWVAGLIDEARSAGVKWIVVGTHYNCITIGEKVCEMGEDLFNLLIEKKVDLILQGHEHNYQRSKQLSHGALCTAVNAGSYNSDCVVNDGLGGQYIKGAGTVVLIVGTGGRPIRDIYESDTEAGYFAKWMGGNSEPRNGFMKFNVSESELRADFVPFTSTSNFTDSFTINESSVISTPTPTSTPNSGAGIGLTAEYFNNSDFTNLSGTRVDPTVNFNWDYAAPLSVMNTDTFSVRWTGSVMPQYSQTYTFCATTDDGVRLWVNSQQLVDNWVNQGAKEVCGSVALQAGNAYALRMEYYDNSGRARAELRWSSPSTPKEIIPQSALYPVGDIAIPTPTPTNSPTSAPTASPTPTSTGSIGDGLIGAYYDASNFTDLKVTRIDPVVNFNWDKGVPISGMGADTFSVRWTGWVKPLSSESYTFCTTTDDGVRLWVNSQQLINDWANHAAKERCGSINLAADQKYLITMEYYDGSGRARAELRWSSPSTFKQIIPQSALFSN